MSSVTSPSRNGANVADPPRYNLDAERTVLGSMIRDNATIDPVRELVTVNDFYVDSHRRIYRAIVELADEGTPGDIVTVSDRLEGRGEIGPRRDVGYPQLAEILDAAPTAANAAHYAGIVRRDAQARRLAALCDRYGSESRRPTFDITEALETFQQAAIALAGHDPDTKTGFRWAPLDSTEFAEADYRPEWLVRRILVARQPAIVGGPKKSLKTSLLIDLAVSLASATPFLGTFEVPRLVRVAVLSGESGPFTLQETARRICVARGLELADIAEQLIWQFTLPQLATPSHLAELTRGLRGDGIDVAISDPLYLSLLAGQEPGGARAESLYDMGPLLLAVSRACLEAGATPVLAHHTRKHAAHEPIDLDDLAFSGVSEFARQWLLVSRRESYQAGTGEHRLWLNVGGSVGHGGLWSLDIAEGSLADDFSGRRWDVTVQTSGQERQHAEAEREQARQARQGGQDRIDDTTLMQVIDRQAGTGETPLGFTRARDLAGLSGPRMQRSVERLIIANVIERVPVTATIGNGATRRADGLRRVRDADS